MRPPAFLFRSWSTRPELSPEAERALWVLLEEDVKFVEDYLGRPLSSWRKRYEERGRAGRGGKPSGVGAAIGL